MLSLMQSGDSPISAIIIYLIAFCVRFIYPELHRLPKAATHQRSMLLCEFLLLGISKYTAFEEYSTKLEHFRTAFHVISISGFFIFISVEEDDQTIEWIDGEKSVCSRLSKLTNNVLSIAAENANKLTQVDVELLLDVCMYALCSAASHSIGRGVELVPQDIFDHCAQLMVMYKQYRSAHDVRAFMEDLRFVTNSCGWDYRVEDMVRIALKNALNSCLGGAVSFADRFSSLQRDGDVQTPTKKMKRTDFTSDVFGITKARKSETLAACWDSKLSTMAGIVAAGTECSLIPTKLSFEGVATTAEKEQSDDLLPLPPHLVPMEAAIVPIVHLYINATEPNAATPVNINLEERKEDATNGHSSEKWKESSAVERKWKVTF